MNKYINLIVILIIFINNCEKNPVTTITLKKPSNVQLEKIIENQIRLKWDYNQGDALFIIDKKIGESGWKKNYASVETTSYIDFIQTSSDTVFSYRISALINNQMSDYSETLAWFSEISTPNIISLIQTDENTIKLGWQDNSYGEAGFQISKKIGNSWNENYAFIDTNLTKFYDNNSPLINNPEYKIKAVKGNSGTNFSQSIKRNLSSICFGTDSTFEIASWNVQHFAKHSSTVDNMIKIIRSLSVDIIALQEIEDETEFGRLIDSLDNYSGYRANSAYVGINLAFLYNNLSIANPNIYEIYQDESRPFPRAPLVMEFTWNSIPVIVLNNHLKCCGNGVIENDVWDEEHRRQEASTLLEEYVENNFNNKNVIILGDFNDEITDISTQNVFQNFIDNSNKYKVASMDIATGPSTDWSYPTYPSHLDHIFITDELFDEFNNPISDIMTLKVEKYMEKDWNDYAVKISDHRPVILKLKF